MMGQLCKNGREMRKMSKTKDGYSYPKVIGIMGKMGSGKDTIADYLVEGYGYEKLSLSDLLRDELTEELNWLAGISYNKLDEAIAESYGKFGAYAITDEIILAFKTGSQNWPAVGDWLLEKSPASRALQQWYGTEYRRVQDEHYWLRLWMNRALDRGFIGKDRKFVMPSVRFENEAKFCRALGECWIVQGRETSNEGIEGHVSENVPVECSQWAIDNSWDLKQLYFTVDNIIAYNASRRGKLV